MPAFELKRRLPSCRVDKETLLVIEDYILEQARDVFGLTPEVAQSKLSVVIQESLGTERLASAKEMRSDTFPDTTVSVQLEVREWRPSCTLDVYFHRESFHSSATVRAEGAQAREKAIGFFDGLLRRLESHRSYAWFFHPHPAIGGALSALTFMSFGAVPWAFTAAVPEKLAAGFIALPLVLLIFHVGARLNPYTSFASRRADIREKTWNWFVGGMVAFLVFGTLLAGLRKKILGF